MSIFLKIPSGKWLQLKQKYEDFRLKMSKHPAMHILKKNFHASAELEE